MFTDTWTLTFILLDWIPQLLGFSGTQTFLATFQVESLPFLISCLPQCSSVPLGILLLRTLRFLGSPREKPRRNPREISILILLGICLPGGSTEEVGSSELAEALAPLGCFYRLGTKQVCAKRRAFWKWQTFPFQGRVTSVSSCIAR